MSVDKVRILIKVLEESHLTFSWEMKSTFDSTQTDRQAGLDLKSTSIKVKASWSVCLSVCYGMSMLSSD